MLSSQIDPPVRGELSAAISNAVVRVFHEYTGRGPNRARSFVSDDLVSVVLEETSARVSAISSPTARAMSCSSRAAPTRTRCATP